MPLRAGGFFQPGMLLTEVSSLCEAIGDKRRGGEGKGVLTIFLQACPTGTGKKIDRAMTKGMTLAAARSDAVDFAAKGRITGG